MVTSDMHNYMMLFINGRFNDDCSNAISVEHKNRKINKHSFKNIGNKVTVA